MLKKNFVTLAILICFVFNSTSSHAKSVPWFDSMPKGCKAEFLSLKKKTGWKAFAISYVYQTKAGIRQSCGWSSSFNSKASAAKIALRTCQSEVRKSRGPKIAKCRVVFTKK